MNCWLKPLVVTYLWFNGVHHNENVSECWTTKHNLQTIENVQKTFGCTSNKLQKYEDILTIVYNDAFNCTNIKERKADIESIQDHIFSMQNHYCTSTQNFLNKHPQDKDTIQYKITANAQNYWNCHPIKTVE